jgi:bifunctional dethiobiotin synthetase / adenosylmethionine---8-amino-7-oxononanoate aminotransferase
VVAVHLRPKDGAGGYSSGEAAAVTWALRGAAIYARPLGNVVYVMVTPTTTPETAASLLQELRKALDVVT